jgi:hypothetical protein
MSITDSPLLPSWLRGRGAFAVGLTFASLVSVSGRADVTRDDDNLRADVLACEDAVAHLRDCCPAASQLRCRYLYEYHDNTSCDGSGESYSIQVRPDLSETESICITSKSCSELAAIGVCDRASRVVSGRYGYNGTPRSDGYGYGYSYARSAEPPRDEVGAVCP